jgi:hypothetical protein
MTQFLFLDGVSEPGGADHLSCREIKGVEDHYPSTRSAVTATAFDFESHRLAVELAMHGPTASKLDHGEAPIESVIARAYRCIESGRRSVLTTS